MLDNPETQEENVRGNMRFGEDGWLQDWKVIGFMDNQLTSLPESISDLTVRGHLDLRYNRLASLPDSISGFTVL